MARLKSDLNIQEYSAAGVPEPGLNRKGKDTAIPPRTRGRT